MLELLAGREPIQISDLRNLKTSKNIFFSARKKTFFFLRYLLGILRLLVHRTSSTWLDDDRSNEH